MSEDAMRLLIFCSPHPSRAIGPRALQFWLAALLVGFVLLGHGSLAQADDVTIKQIRDEYRKSIAKLDRIWTRSTVTRETLIEIPALNVLKGQELPQEVEWAIDGEKFMVHHNSKDVPSWYSFDGKTTWKGHYDFSAPIGSRNLKCAETQKLSTVTDSRLRLGLTPGSWLGLYISVGVQVQSGENFSAMLDKPSTMFVGSDEIDRTETYHVKTIYSKVNSKHASNEVPVDVWFDPAHGYLPRKIVIGFAKPVTLTVSEFVATHDTFLPKQMKRESEASVTDYCVVEVRSPSELKAAFRLPEGTPTFSTDGKAGVNAISDFLDGSTPETRAADRAKRRSEVTP